MSPISSLLVQSLAWRSREEWIMSYRKTSYTITIVTHLTMLNLASQNLQVAASLHSWSEFCWILAVFGNLTA
jgi:hypothetical protein